MKNRLGRVKYSRDMGGAELCEMFGMLKFVPSHSGINYDTNTVEVCGFSPWFDELEPGAFIPVYRVILHTVENVLTTIEVERVV